MEQLFALGVIGPEGVDTLSVAANVDLNHLGSIFPTEYDGGNELMQKKGRVIGGIKEHPGGSPSAAMSGYEETIGETQALCDAFRNPAMDPSSQLCVIQEFGTTMGILVGKALVQENQAFWGRNER